MLDLLSTYKDNFTSVFIADKKEYHATFDAIDKESNMAVFLKVYDKRLIEDGPKDLLLRQIEREKELTQLCRCENVVELFKVLETDISYIFVYEKCEEETLDKYQFGKNTGNYEKYFIKIARSLAEAMKMLNTKKVIHRDIKPSNIFLQKIDYESEDDIEDNCIIKLGDFGSSIKREENDNMQIGTLLYLPPEIIQNEDYDEKCDMWSLGVTLYKIYNSYSPYGLEYDFDSIQEKLFSDKFLYKFTGIPSLDILFERLLTKDPKNRMTHEEYYEYVYSQEFMKPQGIYKINIYGNIYKEIQNIMNSEEYKIVKITLFKPENHDKVKIKGEQIKKVVKLSKIFDISYKIKKEKEKNNKKIKYNNILYYNEDTKHPKNLAKEIEMFEKETTGTFLFINNISSFELTINEIKNQILLDKRCIFNLIVTGSSFEKIMNCIIDSKGESCFKYKCIFCMDISAYLHLQEIFKEIKLVSKSKRDVVQNFIKSCEDENTKIFPVDKFITYEEYQNEYFIHHLKIASYYGHLSPEDYEKNLEKMKKLIKDDKKELFKTEEKLKDSFETFKLETDIDTVNKRIIKEYTMETFYGDLNRWLRNLNRYSNEEIAYFTSRFMFSLNSYGTESKKFFDENTMIYRGTRMNLLSLLAYERAQGKIIGLTAFTSTSTNLEKTKKFRRIKKKNQFSVIYYITNKYFDGWIPNGIDIHEISQFKGEREILFQPFSFYIITKVVIDIKEKKGEIYLETIGKNKILELELQNGKLIQYNKDLKIMESI